VFWYFLIKRFNSLHGKIDGVNCLILRLEITVRSTLDGNKMLEIYCGKNSILNSILIG